MIKYLSFLALMLALPAAAQDLTPVAPPAQGAPVAPAVAAAPVAGTAPALTPAQIAANKYKTEIVCKSSIETGSLVARHKQCLTRKQWDYVSNEHEAFARRIVEENSQHFAHQ